MIYLRVSCICRLNLNSIGMCIVVNIERREFECAEAYYPSVYGLRRDDE